MEAYGDQLEQSNQVDSDVEPVKRTESHKANVAPPTFVAFKELDIYNTALMQCLSDRRSVS